MDHISNYCRLIEYLLTKSWPLTLDTGNAYYKHAILCLSQVGLISKVQCPSCHFAIHVQLFKTPMQF